MAVEKFERDGKVAVLISPGFGAGWSTWNYGEECIFDPEIVQAVLAHDLVKAETIAKRKYPEFYTGGVDDLTVAWVDKGDRFEIHEYDGNESLRVFGPTDGYVA